MDKVQCYLQQCMYEEEKEEKRKKRGMGRIAAKRKENN